MLTEEEYQYLSSLSNHINMWKTTGINTFSPGERIKMIMIAERVTEKKVNVGCNTCVSRAINTVIHQRDEYERVVVNQS